jgi:DNA-binding transcriptional MocR family regulator
VADRGTYRHIADELRQRIQSGELPAGAMAPSELSLNESYSVARGTVRSALALLVGSSAIVGRRVGAPGWLSPVCLVLPPEQRIDWLMLVAAVLHAESDRAGRRRQVVGFLAALPVTVLIGWRLWLHSRRRPTRGSGS